MIRIYRALGLCAALIAAGFWLDHRGYERGKAACDAEHVKASDQTQVAIDATTRTASSINTATQSWLWAALPPIDIRTQEARERVRIVYRETESTQVADRCLLPARNVRVQVDLNAARSRIATATRSPLRTSTDASARSGP